MKKLFVTTALCITALCAQTAAADTYLGYDDGAHWSILDHRTKSNGYYQETWLKREIVEDLVTDGIGVGGYQLSKLSIDCRNQTIAIVAIYNYGSSGKLTFSASESKLRMLGMIEYEDIIPNSNFDIVASHICQ